MKELLKKVYGAKKLSLLLTLISHAVVLFGCCAFGFILGKRVRADFACALVTVLVAAVSFVGVSLYRHKKNAPRPYEIYDFYECAPKDKTGHSFPSRHVFSAFVIATLALPDMLYVAIPLYALGICLAICRVLLGLHFIRDVVWGAVIGVLCGAVGVLLTSLIR